MAVALVPCRTSRNCLAGPLVVLALYGPAGRSDRRGREQLENVRPALEFNKDHAKQGSFFRMVMLVLLFVVAAQVLGASWPMLSRWSALRGVGQALRARWLVPATSVLGVLAGLFLIYESVHRTLRPGVGLERNLTHPPEEAVAFAIYSHREIRFQPLCGGGGNQRASAGR